ncbi:hypothetical protein [uncultured Photobacterium sp.]|uniref:hypothetical protein n=1 Tax=uncultured Photobacterium sp. TaxID=173973 RepID=UPI002630BFD1|nr:hypothetical protein [uncultured Photobacterium sp.]
MIFLVGVIILSVLIWYGYNTFTMFSGNIENEYIYRVINGQGEILSHGWGNIWHYTISILLLVGVAITALVLSYCLFKWVAVMTDSELQNQRKAAEQAKQKAIEDQDYYQSEAERVTKNIKTYAQEKIESAYQDQLSIVQNELSERQNDIEQREQEVSAREHEAQELKQQAEQEVEFYRSEYQRLKTELDDREKQTTHSRNNAIAAMNRRRYKKAKQP